MSQAETNPIHHLAHQVSEAILSESGQAHGMSNPIGATRRAQSFRQREAIHPESLGMKSPISLGFLGKTKKFHSPLVRQNVKILFQPPVSFS